MIKIDCINFIENNAEYGFAGNGKFVEIELDDMAVYARIDEVGENKYKFVSDSMELEDEDFDKIAKALRELIPNAQEVTYNGYTDFEMDSGNC